MTGNYWWWGWFQWMMMMIWMKIVVGASWIVVVVVIVVAYDIVVVVATTATAIAVAAMMMMIVMMMMRGSIIWWISVMMRTIRVTIWCWWFYQWFWFSSWTIFIIGMLLHMKWSVKKKKRWRQLLKIQVKSTKAIKGRRRKWSKEETIFHFIISSSFSSSSSSSNARSLENGKQGSYKNNHYLPSTQTQHNVDWRQWKQKVLRRVEERNEREARKKDIKWKNNSVSFSYQLPIYHHHHWGVFVVVVVVGQRLCTIIIIFLSFSFFHSLS